MDKKIYLSGYQSALKQFLSGDLVDAYEKYAIILKQAKEESNEKRENFCIFMISLLEKRISSMPLNRLAIELDKALVSGNTNNTETLLKLMAKKTSMAYTEKQEKTRQKHIIRIASSKELILDQVEGDSSDD